MILNIKKILFVSLILFLSCTKEIDISEFSNDFSHYESELRIEALILSNNNDAIVRIDKSVLINDVEVYNCIDDDNDWNSDFDDLGTDGEIGDPFDEDGDCGNLAAQDDPCYTEPSEGEGNGIADCGEPHVDETDEIITQLHLKNCNVSITNGNSTCNFKYDESADFYWYFPYDRKSENIDFAEKSFYGAYVPDEACTDFNWRDYDGNYEFQCDCGEYGKVVSKEPIQISTPVVFFDESDVDTLDIFLLSADNCIDIDCLKEISTLWDSDNGEYQKRYFARYAVDDYIYYSSIIDHLYFQNIQYFYDENNDNEDRWIYYHGHPDAASNACDNCGIHNNITTMKEAVVTDILELEPENLPPTSFNQYYYEMFTFSDSYKNYYFNDQLYLDDPERTNLRDGENTPIMGAFGSMTSEKIYFRIIDCTVYGPSDCESTEITKSICEWNENISLQPCVDYEGPICLPVDFSTEFCE